MPIKTCNSLETLKSEIDLARRKVTLDESEETWDTIAQGVLHLTHLCNIGGFQFPSEMVTGIRSLSRPLNNALNSERSRLSGAAIELVTALAIGLGSAFDPLVSHFVPTLLALCGRTNKVFTSRAKACILAIIQHTHLPSLLPHLAELANHKSVSPRLTAAEGILACLNCFNPPDLEKETRARIVEGFIKLTARDASAEVRKASKEVFKAYKILMPARVESFVAPLTPVIKKYLDIQAGPSRVHGVSSNAAQKQASRPSSRASNKVIETSQRPANSTLAKPPRPATDDSAHNRQRPAVHGLPTAVDVRGPRQRTVSQMQRDPPPRNLHFNTQSSTGAQRCVVPSSAAARQAVQHPAPSVARVLPVRSVPTTGGPQRPPPTQMKFNLPPDRFKVTGNGAKRVPLPPELVNGQSGTMASGKLAPGQKGVPPRRPIGNQQKVTRPLAKAKRKEISPTLIPLPPSPSIPATKIPLPPSPDCAPHAADAVAQDKPVAASLSRSTGSDGKQLGSVVPCQQHGEIAPPSTPITILLSSIQRGFLFTPSSPLSPPQNYLPAPGNLPENRPDTMTGCDFTKGPTVGAPFCVSLEDDSDADGLDRHALRDLN